jgi:hypothetical protein
MSVVATEFAGSISNAVGMGGVAGWYEKDKSREGEVCFSFGIITSPAIDNLFDLRQFPTAAAMRYSLHEREAFD